jgi:hypothetical protein
MPADVWAPVRPNVRGDDQSGLGSVVVIGHRTSLLKPLSPPRRFPAFVIGIKFYQTLLQNVAHINREAILLRAAQSAGEPILLKRSATRRDRVLFGTSWTDLRHGPCHIVGFQLHIARKRNTPSLSEQKIYMSMHFSKELIATKFPGVRNDPAGINFETGEVSNR